VRAPAKYGAKAAALNRDLYQPRPRDEVAIVREFGQALNALGAGAADWLTFLPTPAAVEQARVTVAALSSLLTELAVKQAGARP
jgi:hypothetical protein